MIRRPPRSTLIPYPTLVRSAIASDTALPLTEARDHFEAQGARDALVELSGQLRTVAVSLTKIDRKSTRLNSSHAHISYAVFCLKEKARRSGGTPARGRTVR